MLLSEIQDLRTERQNESCQRIALLHVGRLTLTISLLLTMLFHANASHPVFCLAQHGMDRPAQRTRITKSQQAREATLVVSIAA
jgi:hypothetical protein